MYSRFLVPLDGSPLAEQALPYVRLLAPRFGAAITLLRAFGPVPQEWADPTHGVFLDQLVEGYRAREEEYLNRVKASLGHLGVPVATVATEGDAARHIIEEAQRHPDTVIAMCTHGRSGVSRWLLGSTAEKVLLAAGNPLLVCRSKNKHTTVREASIKTITVPLDGSPLAEQVLPYVTWLANSLHSKVQVVRAISPGSEYGAFLKYGILGALSDTTRLEKEATEYLEGVRYKLQAEGTIYPVECKVLRGRAAGAIIDHARDVPDNLVAMTTHGRSGVGRWLMGSVADRVVRYCGEPVLLVRAR